MPSLVILVSAVLVLSWGQTDKHTDRQTESYTGQTLLNALLPPLSSASVIITALVEPNFAQTRYVTCQFQTEMVSICS